MDNESNSAGCLKDGSEVEFVSNWGNVLHDDFV